MNERIFELIQTQNGFRSLLWTEEDKQEFAELIVRECADLVKDFYQEDEFTCYSAATEIKQHFGVDE